MRPVGNALIGGILFVLSSCAEIYVYPANSPPVACESLVSFFYEPNSKQVADFKTYDLDHQYQLYICGVQYIEPAMMQYGWYIAARGKSAIPYLEERLAKVPNGKTAQNIIYVFYAMRQLGSYDVAGDSELMRQIDEAIGRISNAVTKEVATSWRNGIKAAPPRTMRN